MNYYYYYYSDEMSAKLADQMNLVGLPRKAFIDGQARLDGWIEARLARARVSPPTRKGEFFMRSTQAPCEPPATLAAPAQTKDPKAARKSLMSLAARVAMTAVPTSGLQSDYGPHQDPEVSPGTSAFCTGMEV